MKNCILCFLLLFSSYFAMAQKPVGHIPQFLFYKLDKKPLTKQNIPRYKKAFFVFFDSDCEHCQHAMREINSQYKRFNRTEIYLVTLDDQTKINRFMATYGPDLPGKRNVTILQDLGNEFITDFKPRQYPSMLLFSAHGKLLMYQDDPNALSEIVKLL
jgi:thioredoxin-related protein